MKDVLEMVKSLHRPRLLIRAARIGVEEYRRQPHLRRHLGPGALPHSAQALLQLLAIEADLDAQRQRRDAGYSAPRHVEVLIAMMGEARILRATRVEDAVS